LIAGAPGKPPLVNQGALSGYHYDQLQDTALKEEGKRAAQKKQVVQLFPARSRPPSSNIGWIG
jgi:hypothetical protein